MLDLQHRCGVMNSAIAVVVIANRAVQHVVSQNTIEGFALRGADRGDSVTTIMPPVPREQARISFPLTSTMQVSQV